MSSEELKYLTKVNTIGDHVWTLLQEANDKKTVVDEIHGRIRSYSYMDLKKATQKYFSSLVVLLSLVEKNISEETENTDRTLKIGLVDTLFHPHVTIITPENRNGKIVLKERGVFLSAPGMGVINSMLSVGRDPTDDIRSMLTNSWTHAPLLTLNKSQMTYQ